tara:strand:+ start:690 stop:1316 length:627 start_codon:yes stop_codon:yes gene_type:complete
MVLVSHKYKFIYIKNKKVAGSSVESFFGKYCIDPKKVYNYNDAINEHIDEFGIIGSRTTGRKNSDKWINHKDAKSIRNDLGNEKFDQYLKFCVIRNPYDKMVSLYYYIKSELPFKEFAKKYHRNNLNIHSINGKSVCDYFIRYEYLEEDIKKLCKKLNIDSYDLSLLPIHKSNYRKDKSCYSKFYDEVTKKIVYMNHIKEFKLFGYCF